MLREPEEENEKEGCKRREGWASGYCLDPVWSERVSPVSFARPERFTPPPCGIVEVSEVDVVLNHYDHLDVATIEEVHRRGERRVRCFCALGGGAGFLGWGLRCVRRGLWRLISEMACRLMCGVWEG